MSADYFYQQLNRVLAEVGGELIIKCDTSSPQFGEFITKLYPSDIGKIESRTDINNSVDATLANSIWLPNGVCHIRPYWCAYKQIRADEIISTLLIPLHLTGLDNKTYINVFDEDFHPLFESVDMELDHIFYISKYKINDKAVLQKYAEKIQLASNAFQNTGNYDGASQLYNE